MATILDKDIIRESTVVHSGREIVVTLTDTQEISFKLKGMKSGAVSISIKDLYEQLAGGEVDVEDEVVVVKEVSKLSKDGKDNPMIGLYDLRVKINTLPMPYDQKVVLEGIVVNCIKEIRKPYLDKEHEEKNRKK
jgi:hypothetical protein